MQTFEKYAFYEQVKLCRINPYTVEIDKAFERISQFIPDEIKAGIGSFEGTGFEINEVVRVSSECSILPALIQNDSFVVLKACLHYVNPGQAHFLVENAEGVECLLNATGVSHCD